MPGAYGHDGLNLKREAEAPPEEDTRPFKLGKKIINPGLGEIYDPGLIPIKIKKKEEREEIEPIVPSFSPDAQPPPPKWTTLQLKPPAEDLQSQDALGRDSSVKAESAVATSKWMKPQWSAPLPDIKPEERGKVFGIAKEPTDIKVDAPPGQKPEFKVEPDDGTPLQSDTPNTLTGSLFKKRKTPTGIGKGRRPI